MKTKITILAVLAFSFLSILSANANSHKVIEEITTKVQLHNTLESMFRTTPLVDLMGDDIQCNLTVQFRINKNHEVTEIKIDGNNADMARYAYYKLLKAKLNVDASMEQKAYTVDLHFELK